MISTLYRGSVKDLLGPIKAKGVSAIIFEYTDAYSVFDWGRMPDELDRKGEALATLAAALFDKVESAETWRTFSRSPGAAALRSGNPMGADFDQLGEELQRSGLRTHYLGLLGGRHESYRENYEPVSLKQLQAPSHHLVVRQVSVVKPTLNSVDGKVVPDYSETVASPPPRLVPLEVIFRFSCPPGSSLPERDSTIKTGQKWDFPYMELFTKLEPSDRHLETEEALAISGLSDVQLHKILIRTAWLAGWLKNICSKAGLELADGKLEWGVGEDGEVFLVDAIGPDELRILRDEVQLSKEFLRIHYRKTAWFADLKRAKAEAADQGIADWKELVEEDVPPLPVELRELAIQMYLALANELSGRRWFEAWSLDKVVAGIRRLSARRGNGE